MALDELDLGLDNGVLSMKPLVDDSTDHGRIGGSIP